MLGIRPLFPSWVPEKLQPLSLCSTGFILHAIPSTPRFLFVVRFFNLLSPTPQIQIFLFNFLTLFTAWIMCFLICLLLVSLSNRIRIPQQQGPCLLFITFTVSGKDLGCRKLAGWIVETKPPQIGSLRKQSSMSFDFESSTA